MTTIERWDVVEAQFSPRDEATLKPGLAAKVGKRTEFTAMFVIEDGPYEGQYEMHSSILAPYLWCPEEDLADVVFIKNRPYGFPP